MVFRVVLDGIGWVRGASFVDHVVQGVCVVSLLGRVVVDLIGFVDRIATTRFISVSVSLCMS